MLLSASRIATAEIECSFEIARMHLWGVPYNFLLTIGRTDIAESGIYFIALSA